MPKPTVHPHFARRRQALELPTEDGTPQGEAGAGDINKIIARYQANGTPMSVNQRQPLYGDFTNAEDLHSSMNRTQAAQEHFMTLPASVRAAAQNSPVEFLRMFEDPAEAQKLVDAGLELDTTEDDLVKRDQELIDAALAAHNPPPKPAPKASTEAPPEPAGGAKAT